MAYTILPTQSAGQTASAAGWANLVKADIESMGPHLIVRKTSDQSVTSSTTLVDDTALLMAVAANAIWQVKFFVVYGAGTPGDIKIAFTFPTGGDLRMSVIAADNAGLFIQNVFSSTTSPTTSRDFKGTGTTAYTTLPLEGVFVNGGTPGNLTLQFAQFTSDGTATTIKAQSTLWGVQLA